MARWTFGPGKGKIAYEAMDDGEVLRERYEWVRQVAQLVIGLADRFGAFEAGREARARANVARFVAGLMRLPTRHRALPTFTAKAARSVASIERVSVTEAHQPRAAPARSVAGIERVKA